MDAPSQVDGGQLGGTYQTRQEAGRREISPLFLIKEVA